MRRILTSFIAVAGFAMAASAATINNSTSFPSKSGHIWTTQKDAGIAWGRQNNAVTIVIVGDTVTCSKCRQLDAALFNTPAWQSFVAANNLALVYWDRGILGNTQSWNAYASPNVVKGSFPTINIYAGGTFRTRYLAQDSQKTATYLINQLLTWVAQYPGITPGTVGFTTSAQTVMENAGNAVVTVARTGGTSEAQSFKVTAAAGTHNQAVDQTLTWVAGDGATKTVNIPLLDDQAWTSPTQRVITVSLDKTSGSAAVGITSMNVTIFESVPYAPGEIGFQSETLVVSEADAPISVAVERKNGSIGTVGVTYTVYTNSVVADTGTLTWADTENQAKFIDLQAVLPSNPGYDGIIKTVSVGLSDLTGSPQPTFGISEAVVEFRDEAISATLAEYDVPAEGAFSSDDDWFYSDGLGVRSAPLANGVDSVLTFTAPSNGLLTVQYGGLQNSGALTLNTTGADTLTATGTTLEDAVLALAAGDTITWTAEASADGYVPYVEVVQWEPVAAASAPAPANGASFLLAEYGSKTLEWSDESGLAIACYVEIGSAADALADAGEQTNGVSLADAGIAAAQGTVFWSVTLEVEGDLGTVMLVPSPVWSFTIFDRPTFENNDLPAAGGSSVIYTKTQVSMNASASRGVSYTANFGGATGLTINPQTGLITGTPKKAGTYSVTVTAADSGGRTTTHTFTLTVAKTPTGKYNGLVMSNGQLAGTIALTASASGKATGKLVMDKQSLSLKGAWVSRGDGLMEATLEGRTTESVTVALKNATTLSGTTRSGAQITGEAATKTATYTGYYTALVNPASVTSLGSLNYKPDGYGYVTFTVKSGSARYSGYLPDGTRLSGSAPVFTKAYSGLAIYKQMYQKRGDLAMLAPLGSAGFELSGTWNYPGKLGGSDAFRANVSGLGGLYNKSTGFSALNSSSLYIAGEHSGAVQASAASLSTTTASIKLKGKAATGLITCKAGKYSCKGVAVPSQGVAAGFYLAPHAQDKRFKQSHQVMILKPQ